LLGKLAVLTPRPRINLLLYHGILAPHARWRPEAVAREGLDGASACAAARGPGTPPACSAAPAPADPIPPCAPPEADGVPPRPPRPVPPVRHQTWASLMRRAFALDVLACPAAGAR
jgi:hypothetical protein